MIDWVELILIGAIIGFAWGVKHGMRGQLEYDADQAIYGEPSLEWQEALIDAEARKQKKGLKP